MTHEELDLARAKDMVAAIGDNFNRLVKYLQDHWLSGAASIRPGDEARGLCVVPMKPTPEMIRAGCLSLPHNDQTIIRWQQSPAVEEMELDDMTSAYHSMLAASPFAPEKKECFAAWREATSNWQPIATAPTDGTIVEVYAPAPDKARWHEAVHDLPPIMALSLRVVGVVPAMKFK